MFIKNIRLKNYRNYKELNLNIDKRFNVIYGDNAQGKTNILEAIYICSSGRSHRTSRDVELVNHESKSYYIKIDVEKKILNSEIEVQYENEGKKKLRINEIPLKKIGDLMGNLNTVLFSPEDLLIIKEGPSERRRFIDITISQLKPSYFYDLQQYMKILDQRNSLLKDIQNNRKLLDTLDVWNENIIKTGSRIMKTRKEFMDKLSKFAKTEHEKLTGGLETLNIRYNPSFPVNRFDDIKEIENDYRKSLERNKEKEIFKCTTLIGPQRDDYEIFLDQKSLKMYGSQGQQRTAVLSVKMAEIDIMKEETGEWPVLLLDDVLSELDSKRQEYLFENITGIQVFITCTEKSFFSAKASERADFFKVTKGVVIKE
ncbi:MAG: DNA replication/repair protein RecF [Bacillota bacterium]|nr:DNA replication/repair protein RecF [Bacillota bacterium]